MDAVPINPSGMKKEQTGTEPNSCFGGASLKLRCRVGQSIAAACTLFLLLPVATGCSYGPTQSQSGLQSALLLPNQRTVALTYQNLLYRPATGLAAFPDGGVPRYARDSTVIATVDLEGGKPRILQHFENRGVHGSASLTLRLSDADPDHVLVIRSIQLSISQPSTLQWWRLAWRDGSLYPYPDLTEALRTRGRKLGSPEFGDVRVIGADGTLLLGAQAEGHDELWVRRTTGQYDLIDTIKHFYGMQGTEIYYWSGDEALVLNWRTGKRRVVARYDPTIRQTTRLIADDVTVRAIERPSPAHLEVRVSSDRQAIILRRVDGTESPLALATGALGD